MKKTYQSDLLGVIHEMAEDLHQIGAISGARMNIEQEEYMKPRLGHIAIRAEDAEKTAAFYREVLGFPEAFRMHKPGEEGSPPILTGIYLYIAESQFIEIFPGGLERRQEGPGVIGPVHFCIEVEHAAAALEELRCRGAPIDKELTTGYSRCIQFWTHDPDGNAIEFMELPPESLQRQANERLAR